TLARAAIVCAAAGVFAAVERAEFRSLPDALATRGLTVVPNSVRWLDPPGLSARRALVLARQSPHAPADVFVATARTGPSNRVISLRNVSNLTRSRDADEQSLVVDGHFAAFLSRVSGQVVAITVLDTKGDAVDPSADASGRFRTAVTRWQQTGRTAGYGVD